jgi:hypothetical protein
MDQLHRARAVERGGGDEVFDAVRLHFHEQVLHAAGFELEHASRLAAFEEVEDVLVSIGCDGKRAAGACRLLAAGTA